MKFTPNPSFIFQIGKNQVLQLMTKAYLINENEKYFLNCVSQVAANEPLSLMPEC